ncbi:NAD(P)-dependent oxidoreductase [Rhizobium sp. BK376]|uniref:NAD(P)-dependent oxidoreductase n=1 Tax=Rhizobium sp. BK376 TaxID=2512149 RepID=UPI002478F6F7|nr:NAD(P)-dependent oxidoreductase [Rhizobium sp. BK376]
MKVPFPVAAEALRSPRRLVTSTGFQNLWIISTIEFVNFSQFCEIEFRLESQSQNSLPCFAWQASRTGNRTFVSSPFRLSLSQRLRRRYGMAKVAFIGMGVMGYPMAGHLMVKGGHEVTVYNRTAAKAEQWVKQYGGKSAATPAAAAEGADFVFTCVGNDDDLRSVTVGKDGVLSGMKAGAILIDNTTASAEVARELHAAAKEKGCGFIDAPVSGGQAGAENGVLTVMCGGDEATFEKAKPVIDAYARMVGLMGDVGAGQLTKMINQICIAGVVQGLAEGIHFGKQAGLDIEKVVDVISKGAAGSWQMENRHKTMNAGKYDFGFAVDWMRKDLDIVLTEARRNGAKLPVTALVDQFYGDVQQMGGNRWDTSSLLARLDKK